jgi:hypothetical protein
MCPADGRVGNGVTVVIVMAGIPSGSPARDSGAESVYVLLPLLQRVGGPLLWGVGEGQEGGVPPPVLGDSFTVEDPYRYSYT